MKTPKLILAVAALAACTGLAWAQNVDDLPALTGAAVDKANDKLLVRDASVSAAAGALRSMTIAELANVPGLFAAATETFSNDVQTLAAAHLAANATLQPGPMLAWMRCLKELEAGGILDELTDGACLRSGYNSSTAPKSIRNVAATVRGTVPIGPYGAIFANDAANTLNFVVTDGSVSTLALDMRYAENAGDLATVFSLTASNGTAGSARSLMTQTGGVIYTGNGASAGYTDTIGDDLDAFSVSRYNHLETIVAISCDNAATSALNGWVNGQLEMTDSTGTYQAIAPLTSLTIGAQRTGASSYTLPHMGSVASWLLFNRVLTNGENLTVAKAVRHLDPREENLLVYGDSRTTQLSTSGNHLGNWPYQYWKSPAIARRFRLCNIARNGWAGITGRDYFAARASHLGINGTSIKGGNCILWFGANDWLNDYTAAQAWSYIATMTAYARNLGYNVTVCTDPEGDGGYTTPQDDERLAFNVLMRANPQAYDSMWDIDLFLKAPRTSAAWLDDYHLNNLGNTWLAGNLLSGGLQGLETP
jgi:hypothetical protein